MSIENNMESGINPQLKNWFENLAKYLNQELEQKPKISPILQVIESGFTYKYLNTSTADKKIYLEVEDLYSIGDIYPCEGSLETGLDTGKIKLASQNIQRFGEEVGLVVSNSKVLASQLADNNIQIATLQEFPLTASEDGQNYETDPQIIKAFNDNGYHLVVFKQSFKPENLRNGLFPHQHAVAFAISNSYMQTNQLQNLSWDIQTQPTMPFVTWLGDSDSLSKYFSKQEFNIQDVITQPVQYVPVLNIKSNGRKVSISNLHNYAPTTIRQRLKLISKLNSRNSNNIIAGDFNAFNCDLFPEGRVTKSTTADKLGLLRKIIAGINNPFNSEWRKISRELTSSKVLVPRHVVTNESVATWSIPNLQDLGLEGDMLKLVLDGMVVRG